MNDTEFSSLAEKTIAKIAEIIEENDKDCLIDIDFQGDILNLQTALGVFVINKHSAAKEIWLSSPISGPHHFSYDQETWCSKKMINLFHILEKELDSVKGN